MPKRFDCEDEPNEFMEMPCRCDCGKWFDLHDGYSSKENNKVICAECKENEETLHYGDTVRFSEDFIVSGRTRAREGDKATVVAQGNKTPDRTSVKVEGKKYALTGVPISILKKLY